jgi:hypothetical protein
MAVAKSKMLADAGLVLLLPIIPGYYRLAIGDSRLIDTV